MNTCKSHVTTTIWSNKLLVHHVKQTQITFTQAHYQSLIWFFEIQPPLHLLKLIVFPQLMHLGVCFKIIFWIGFIKCTNTHLVATNCYICFSNFKFFFSSLLSLTLTSTTGQIHYQSLIWFFEIQPPLHFLN